MLNTGRFVELCSLSCSSV